MNHASGAVCALVDWGTSRVRLWLVDRNGAIVADSRSDDGMGRLAPGAFAGVLERLLAETGAPPGIGVMMCGMVGSRQGWEEAPYLPTPAALDGLAAGAHAVTHAPRAVFILPGVADFSSETPDVIRGEETKLYGLHADAEGARHDLIVMPGTHAKWARVEPGSRIVSAFATSLTGDLFAALGEASVLKHSVGDGAADADHPGFARGVAQSLDEPQTFLSRLFRVRARALLHGADDAAGVAHLSGAIIGMDIAGAMHRFGRPASVALIGSGALGPLYERALGVAGIACAVFDGDDLVRRGLLAAARSAWPASFGDPATSEGTAGDG